ncbi:hypothetical protein BWK69_01010 [Candidatus Parcubacteria bacterium A4]|nr:MAG: hypothetical protein BWK69_01010 [Candidatus Parcubacteria bacterium A4]
MEIENETNKIIRIAWWGLHFGEEEPFVKDKGAGTIFFTGCNLRCVYCQNYQISQQGIGKNYSLQELIGIMLKLQKMGVLNIDLVTPTIWAKQIKEAIMEAKKKGLNIPILWNSNAYEDVEMLKGLEGLVDIYLPDFKYSDDELGFKYSGIKDYSGKAKEAIMEMYQQVGNLKLDEKGIAQKGLVVRHLILPNNIKNSLNVLDHIKEIDNNIYISLMSQYEPIHKSKDFSELNRIINKRELDKVFDHLVELGFENGWVQDIESHSDFLPDFTKPNPFK